MPPKCNNIWSNYACNDVFQVQVTGLAFFVSFYDDDMLMSSRGNPCDYTYRETKLYSAISLY
jgi:hypothetical protein